MICSLHPIVYASVDQFKQHFAIGSLNKTCENYFCVKLASILFLLFTDETSHFTTRHLGCSIGVIGRSFEFAVQRARHAKGEKEKKKAHLPPIFQNGHQFSILLFDCKLALLVSFKVKYSFEFYV